jgi:GAF domain-containing protein
MPEVDTSRPEVLFIDRSHPNDAFRATHQEALKLLRASPSFNLRTVTSFGQVQRLLEDAEEHQFRVVVLWLNSERRAEWDQLFLLLEDVTRPVGIIVVFGFADEAQDIAREVMIRDGYAFACPFNPAVLSAYIEANDLYIQSITQLAAIEERFWAEGTDITAIVNIVFTELQHNPLVGYHRATIDLIDPSDQERYLLAFDKYPKPNRRLQRNIAADPLITRVCEEGVVIISDLERLRDDPESLSGSGWIDTSSTDDIGSWVGMALEHKGTPIGLIMLDHDEPKYYGRYGDRTLRYIDAFRRIVGEVISSYYQQRNERLIAAANGAASEVLEGRELLRTVLQVIRDGIGARNCTFFRTERLLDNTAPHVRAWVSANEPPGSHEPPANVGRIFQTGEGLAGRVLADGRSRIVPHALEHPEFRATPFLSGADHSMLVVAMRSETADEQNPPVIGVITAYVRDRTDAFTPYDRDVVEAISRQLSLTIYRTLTLENIAVISAGINRSLLASDRETILQTICEHALRATTATEAVIHRLQAQEAGREREPMAIIDNYWFPRNGFREPPRLDGTGATDEVLCHPEPTQFSQSDGNYETLAPALRERGVQHVLGIPLRIERDAETLTIGVLFLNKYAPGRFNTVEEFAVKLFANQAANAIYTLEKLSGLQLLSRGNRSLIDAIRTITGSRSRAQILQNIVVQAHTLVGASFSYITLRTSGGTFDKLIAWPEHVDADLRDKIGYFDPVHGSDKQDQRKGVTGLAARDKQSILVSDIERELADPESEIRREYIDFGMNSGTELAVPIMVGSEVFGVINLEHPKPHSFTDIHQNIVELFAEQAAIALQKDRILADHQQQNQRLMTLLDTLQSIVRSEYNVMLPKAVSLTAQAINAEAVIWMPITLRQANGGVASQEPELYVVTEQIVASAPIYQAQRDRFRDLDSVSRQVFQTQRSEEVMLQETIPTANNLPAVLCDHGSRHALCLPLLSGQQCLGVMWVDFGQRSARESISQQMITVLQTYVNQIALAYQNVSHAAQLRQSLQEAKIGFTNQIEAHYRQVRGQSRSYFLAAIVSSVVGAALVFYGAWTFFAGTTTDAQWASVLTAVVGAITQGIGVFVYNQSRAAHDRMDRYHQELYRLRQFEILLLASEQLGDDREVGVKQAIIYGALQRWLEAQPSETA